MNRESLLQLSGSSEASLQSGIPSQRKSRPTHEPSSHWNSLERHWPAQSGADVVDVVVLEAMANWTTQKEKKHATKVFFTQTRHGQTQITLTTTAQQRQFWQPNNEAKISLSHHVWACFFKAMSKLQSLSLRNTTPWSVLPIISVPMR